MDILCRYFTTDVFISSKFSEEMPLKEAGINSVKVLKDWLQLLRQVKLRTEKRQTVIPQRNNIL